MPIYGNYQGAVREVTPIYGNDNGVTKALGFIYGNKDGVVTPIYQLSHVNIPYWTYDVNKSTVTLKTYTGYAQAGIKDIVINGLCFVKITKKACVNVYTKENVKVFERNNII